MEGDGGVRGFLEMKQYFKQQPRSPECLYVEFIITQVVVERIRLCCRAPKRNILDKSFTFLVSLHSWSCDDIVQQ